MSGLLILHFLDSAFTGWNDFLPSLLSCNSDLVLVGRVQVDMVRADTGSDTKLELGCLLDELGGEVTGMEGSGDEDLCLGEFLLEDAVGTFLVARDL